MDAATSPVRFKGWISVALWFRSPIAVETAALEVSAGFLIDNARKRNKDSISNAAIKIIERGC